MKIKLTPELSYVIGLWRKSRCFDGLGVRGRKDLLEVFSKAVLDLQLTTSDKLLTTEDKVYFYHTAYRKFFQEVEQDQMERFKYINEYAANYLAGMFDSCGNVDERGIVWFSHANRQDEMMLLRLGFVTRRSGDRLVLERPVVFLAFIKNYVKIFKDHRIFGYIKSGEKILEKRENRSAGARKTASPKTLAEPAKAPAATKTAAESAPTTAAETEAGTEHISESPPLKTKT